MGGVACLSLPCFPEITDAEVATVAQALGRVGAVTLRNPLVGSVSTFFPATTTATRSPTMVRTPTGVVGNVEDFEIIVVNDGANDDSVEVLKSLRVELPELASSSIDEPRLRRRPHLGVCRVDEAVGFYTHGDAQYDATEFDRCIDASPADTDVVQGFKIGEATWYRKVIGRADHHTVRLLFRLHVRDPLRLPPDPFHHMERVGSPRRAA